MKRFLFLLPLCLVLVTGCATSAMKGTPFYSGEVAKREGPASDRVNLWPIAYWRAPALSVLWPLGEFSDDRLALRPLYAQYRQNGPDSPYTLYRTALGLVEFDTLHHHHRIFPAFWGRTLDERYLHVFPLYWSSVDETREDRLNALLPLWFYDRTRRPDGYETDLWLAGPLYRRQRSPDASRDWLFPLWSRYRDSHGTAYERYGLFLAGDLRDEAGHRHWIAPLYYRDEATDTFVSLPYAQRGSNRAIPLLLSGWGPDKGRILLGLGGWNKDESWLFPLYYRNPSTFLSLAYASGRDWSAIPPLLSAWGDDWGLLAGGLAGWRGNAHWAAPLYYHDADTGLFLSPLYASGDGWSALPPLLSAWGDDWGLLAGGLAGWGEGVHWLAPLYYRDIDEGRFLSLLYAHDRDWSAIPPLLSAWGDDWGRVALGLAGWDRDSSDNLRRSWLAPLYYQDDDRVLSLLYARGRDWSAIPPLLSAWGDDWGRVALGLAGWDRDSSDNLRRSWLAPLYYRDEDHFLTPIYASARHQTILPPLLSAWDDKGEWGRLALGIAGWDHGCHWVLPLYFRSTEEDSLLTPLFGHGKDGASQFSYWATPLVGTRTGKTTGSWFFPLWSTRYTGDNYDHDFLLLGGAKRTDADHSSCWFWPLFDDTSNARVDRLRAEMDAPRAPDRPFTYTREWHDRNGSLTGTSTYYRNDSESNGTSILLGLGGTSHRVHLNPGLWEKHTLDCLGEPQDGPFAQYLRPPEADATNAVARYLAADANWFFPLWNYGRTRCAMFDIASGAKSLDAELETFSALWFLYDWKHESIPAESHDYVRRRVLWRLYHYERLNGDESTDIFPAITWDRRKDGYRKASFLWRLFRYEHDPAKGTSLDILFLPLRRPGAKEN